MRAALVLVLLVLLLPTALAVDLDDYPAFFVLNEEFQGSVVVGDDAPSTDVIASTEIITGMQTQLQRGGIDLEFPIGYAKTAIEISAIDHNMIVVGNACHNEVTNILLARPAPCHGDLEEGEAIIRLFQIDDFVQIVVAGRTNDDTRMAARVLANWEDHNLDGAEVRITGTVDNPSIEELDTEVVSEVPEPDPIQEEETCRDGLWNQDEEGVDCGGVCDPCPPPETCSDGIINQNEEDVDCGGICSPCVVEEPACDGCENLGLCFPQGYRIPDEGGQYCNATTFIAQRADGETCGQGYECTSDVCVNAICGVPEVEEEEQGFFTQFVSWLQSLFN